MKILVPNKMPLVQVRPRIAFVGEAPGENEVLEGQPFVGASGQEVDKLLAKHGIMRAGSFMGNVHQYRPPKGDLSKMSDHELALFKQTPEWAEGLANLRRDLTENDPDITVAFGDTALNALTGRTGITKWRGSLLPNILTGKGKVLPTFHPANFLRVWKNRAVVDFDLGKAKRFVEGHDMNVPQRHFIIHPTFDEAVGILRSFQSREKLAVDFENTTDTGCPICLGFAPSKDFAICIPFNGWTNEQQLVLWREISSLMVNPKIGKIFHNALHDILVFAKWMHIIPRGVYMDTMQAWHNCYPELPKSLAFVTSILTNQPYYKDMHKESDEGGSEKGWSRRAPKDNLYKYNCTDCCVTYEVAEALELEMDDLNTRTGFELDMMMIPIALGMTYKGIKLDFDAMSEGYYEIQSRIDTIDDVLEGIFQGVNTKSNKQMKELLYEKMGLPIIYKWDKKTQTRKPTVNEEALLELARKHQSPQIKLLLKNRQLRTMQGFYKLPFGKDNRMHASHNIGGTETFRWSASESFLGGRNDMNIPEETRHVWVADPGYIFIGFDKTGAEAHFVANKGFICTGDDAYLKILQSGKKIHVWFMEQLAMRRICPIPLDEIAHQMKQREKSEQFKEWYFTAKKAVHAFSYGMGPIRFCKEVAKETDGTVLVETATAKRVKEALYDSIPTIPKWQQAVENHLRTSRTMFTTFGRCRLFLERWGEDLFGEAYAFEPQATASGDDVNRSILTLATRFPNLEILQQNYDSMLAQLLEGEEQEVLEEMKTACQQPMKIWNFQMTKSLDVVIPIVPKVGRNWGDYEPETNPNGMREVK